MGKHVDAAVAELRAAMKRYNECEKTFDEANERLGEARNAKEKAGARENNARYGLIQAAIDDIAADG